MGLALNDEGARTRKKPVNAELNLIPFIDLLVCCICFLLITAVWVHMSRIDVTRRERRPGVGSPAGPSIAVLVGDDGYTITVAGQRVTIPRQGQAYDTETLGRRLREARAQLPATTPLTVVADDPIKYRHLVRTMDIALQSHFETIQISDGSSRL